MFIDFYRAKNNSFNPKTRARKSSESEKTDEGGEESGGEEKDKEETASAVDESTSSKKVPTDGDGDDSGADAKSPAANAEGAEDGEEISKVTDATETATETPQDVSSIDVTLPDDGIRDAQVRFCSRPNLTQNGSALPPTLCFLLWRPQKYILTPCPSRVGPRF